MTDPDVMEEFPLASLLSEVKISSMSVPIVASLEMTANWLVEHLSPDIDTIYTVGWKESENPFIITFPSLLERVGSVRNALFIILDPLTFTSYAGEISLYHDHNNFFLILEELAMSPATFDTITSTFPEMTEFWPAPLDLPLEFIYTKKNTLLHGRQLQQYNQAFIEWRKHHHDSYQPEANPTHILGFLNVFLDEAAASLESLSGELAFSRAPKLRDLLSTLVLNPKKRHFVELIDGQRGIDAFESLYNKISSKNISPLHVIRSDEPSRTKRDKIDGINSSNSPLIIVSDFHFTDDMTPKNIDFYHVTSGGDIKDIISIMSMLKGINYTGSYPRKFHVNNYITETPRGDPTIDSQQANQFHERIDDIFSRTEIKRNHRTRVTFDGDEFGTSLVAFW